MTREEAIAHVLSLLPTLPTRAPDNTYVAIPLGALKALLKEPETEPIEVPDGYLLKLDGDGDWIVYKTSPDEANTALMGQITYLEGRKAPLPRELYLALGRAIANNPPQK